MAALVNGQRWVGNGQGKQSHTRYGVPHYACYTPYLVTAMLTRTGMALLAATARLTQAANG
jgi:hypothetical protein